MTNHPESSSALTFIVAGVVIFHNNKVLLVQEKQPHVYGKWNLPAGKVDQGESLEQAAIREAKEECGLDVRLEKHLLTLHQFVESPVLHAFLVKDYSGKVIFPPDEILNAKWFTLEEIKAMAQELRNQEYVIGAVEAGFQAIQ